MQLQQRVHKGNAALEEHEVYNIRKLLALYRQGVGGQSPREISVYYGMSIEAIRRIERRESWAHLPEVPVQTPKEEQEMLEASAKRLLETQRQLDSGELSYIETDSRLSPAERIMQAVAKEREKGKALDPDKNVEELTERAKAYLGEKA